MGNEENLENQQEVQEVAPELNQEEQSLRLEKLRLEQNLPFAIGAGAVSALVMAVLWAAITVATMYQIGYMALAVGFVVGYAVRFAGKGIDKVYGVIGAVFALLGCVVGNFLSQAGFIAQEPDFNLSYFEALKLLLSDMELTIEIMKESFSPMDLLFYGFAIYEGYRFSFRQIEE